MPDAIPFAADLASAGIPVRHPWRWCVGSGHATLALRADWQGQLAQARRDLGFKHVRFHGILDDDMSTLVCHAGTSVYSFFNTDRIIDFLLGIGMRPLVELSFMPRALASGTANVFHYQGNITPPKVYAQWGALVHALVAHWVKRYGIDEVLQWPLECWNEPNLRQFWTGDQEAYFELYRITFNAVKSVSPRLQVGGPATAAGAWLDDFLMYCKQKTVATDFGTTHYYPTDPCEAFGTNSTSQLAQSPRDVMRTRALEARASAGALPLYFTEWNISSNPGDPLHDGSFAAALAMRIAMSVDDIVDGYSYWTFSDIFEEEYFPSLPFHGGFGMLSLYGIAKPIYRAFQMLHALGEQRVEVRGEHPNVAVWASRLTHPENTATDVLLINQAMPTHAISTETVKLQLAHVSNRKARTVTLARVDEEHANPEGAWRALGAPSYLDQKEI